MKRIRKFGTRYCGAVSVAAVVENRASNWGRYDAVQFHLFELGLMLLVGCKVRFKG